MAFGFAPPPTSDPSHRLGRILESAEWAAAGIPYSPTPASWSAVCTRGTRPRCPPRSWAYCSRTGGWRLALRSAIAPTSRTVGSCVTGCWHGYAGSSRMTCGCGVRCVRRSSCTAVAGTATGRKRTGPGCGGCGTRALHGLRCGAYIMMTRHGWQVLGDGRGGVRTWARRLTSSYRRRRRQRAGSSRPAERAALPPTTCGRWLRADCSADGAVTGVVAYRLARLPRPDPPPRETRKASQPAGKRRQPCTLSARGCTARGGPRRSASPAAGG